MPNVTPSMTIDEFLKLPSSECLRELVRGRVIESKLPRARHGMACGRIVAKIGGTLEGSDFIMITRCGVITHRDPDSVRGPDLLVYPRHKLHSFARTADDYPDFPPVVAFEVLDAGERWLDVMEKGIEYLHVGTQLVALVDPTQETVVVLRDHKPPQLLHAKDEFTLPELLPELRVGVREFFA